MLPSREAEQVFPLLLLYSPGPQEAVVMGRQLISQGGDGDVPFFGVSFSLIFPGTGYQKKAIFLELVE